MAVEQPPPSRAVWSADKSPAGPAPTRAPSGRGWRSSASASTASPTMPMPCGWRRRCMGRSACCSAPPGRSPWACPIHPSNSPTRPLYGAAEARKRGMGTEINVASVDYLGDQWSFLDVPGSIEFQHDAFAALAVCDAAVLVCEPSPERVVALTPLLKYIEDNHIPHIIFVNKIDSAQVRVRDMLGALQAVSARKLVLRQVPIRRPTSDGGEETIGYADLVISGPYRNKTNAPSDLI